jgi:hypothetical protein
MDAEVKKITAETQAISMKPFADQVELKLKHGNQELEVKKVEIQAIQAMALMKQSEAAMFTAISNAGTERIQAATEFHTVANQPMDESQLTMADAGRYTAAAEALVGNNPLADINQGNQDGQSDQSTMAPMAEGSNNPTNAPISPTAPQGTTSPVAQPGMPPA